MHLPPDSALGHALNGDTASWKIEHELLALLVDVANAHRWQHLAANSKHAPRRPPKPLPRPGAAGGEGRAHAPAHRTDRRPRRRHMTHAEMARAFGLKLKPGYRPPPDPRSEPPRDVRSDDDGD